MKQSAAIVALRIVLHALAVVGVVFLAFVDADGSRGLDIPNAREQGKQKSCVPALRTKNRIE